jgi:hypothetical protein
LLCLVMNLVTPKPTQTLLPFGKHNLVILQMELKLLLINFCALVKPSGMLIMGLLCSSPMVTMDKDQNTHLAGLRDIWCLLMKMTPSLETSIKSTMIELSKLICKLHIHPQRQIISIY